MYISVRKSDKFPKCGYICMVIVLRVICFLKERFFVCLFCFCFVFFLTSVQGHPDKTIQIESLCGVIQENGRINFGRR